MDQLKITLQYILPKHLISRLVGYLAAARLGFVSHALMKLFIRAYGINMAEARYENPSDYASFNDFFTRPLKDGARPVVTDEQTLAHPVDGAISQAGAIAGDQLLQAKGHFYTVKALLGGDDNTAAAFQDGTFACIYLAPKDYHRIHMPIAGTLREMIYVPGELFSVNPLTAANVPGLFARNERVVTIFDTAAGPMALVLVGATIVASIETVWAGTVTPPTGSEVFRWQYPAEGPNAVHLEKGAEMGRFKLGSTVVLTFAKDAVELLPTNFPGAVTRMGTAFATKLN
ncbi:archaetidylserine decarboxylase [Rheinheimera texasensis]|uniref:archaetidylserine decarboxylase n=1 Tax=Rheinheimera texasensis TaxID=306205 RepID=UPI0004E0CBC7|nr:archaetidylserine decarboxylase [Rheinheimera texasensis]